MARATDGPGFIELEGVWKKFRYGEVHDRLRDAVPALVSRMLGRRDRDEGLWTGEFWALQDIAFSVRPGQALGIMGPNGAGKSTILKLVTRILRPTAGRCAVRGRIGALIEVASGFHPDLTGRENVYLQGAIMGMPRREIARKFEEIVEFSGVEAFLDTPVKRYSSGMQTRLGFSIAAHLDPDVLVIDEALSVGDAAFQRRAFARIIELVGREIPALVVSHQLDAIATLCSQALLLDRGCVVRAGTPAECIAAYVASSSAVRGPSAGDGAIRVEAMRLEPGPVSSGDRFGVTMDCAVRDDGWVEPESVRIRLRSAQSGELVSELGTDHLGIVLPRMGAFTLSIELQMNVPPGIYLLEAFAWDRVMNRTSFVGPASQIEVSGGAEFVGPVQLNPVGRLRTRA